MDVSEATWQDEVIERSRQVPVVVDFWAAWCGPCRQLAPVLEAAVADRAGGVVLAKVDIDANPALAREHRVMSIPLVRGFRDGQAAEELVGMRPRPAIDAFLDRLVPSVADGLVAAGDEASLREAVAGDPRHAGARLALARLLIDEDRPHEVPELLEPIAYDPAAGSLHARLRLAASEGPDVVAGLAALSARRHEAALTHLLDALGSAEPRLREDVRDTMLGVFRELGEHHPLSTRFRRRLARAIY